MSFKSKMAKLTDIRENKIPGSYQMIGDIMLLKLGKIHDAQKIKLADTVLKEFPYVKTVCEIKGVGGEFREPVAKKLAGNGTETIHKENGILYRIDVSHLMFSKGNLNERKRLIEEIRQGETIVDMFAGIGYFSLGVAKFSNAKNVIAIEKNTKAYNALIENIQLNKLHNISAILGDCRIAAKSMPNSADRVIMGYFPQTENFLPAAIFMLKPKGTINFHNTYNKRELWKKPIQDVEEICKRMECSFKIANKKKVKSYAPNVWHVVMDLEIVKK
ncbi:MAG: class I SAM-dependent methyltransferase family protein [Candidatus Aenigmarchaeota archaeon]|nr:class I SAM-dependent methyltransferase family protein [Candidatus Aenigmarchaeota archaeon]